jgi:hypothetical protein
MDMLNCGQVCKTCNASGKTREDAYSVDTQGILRRVARYFIYRGAEKLAKSGANDTECGVKAAA